MLFQKILGWYGIEWVPKLMRNTCIDNVEKLILSSLLVKHDAVGYVNDLDYRLTFEWAKFHLNISILDFALAISESSFFILIQWDYFKHHVFFHLGTLSHKKVVQTKVFRVLILGFSRLLVFFLDF